MGPELVDEPHDQPQVDMNNAYANRQMHQAEHLMLPAYHRMHEFVSEKFTKKKAKKERHKRCEHQNIKKALCTWHFFLKHEEKEEAQDPVSNISEHHAEKNRECQKNEKCMVNFPVHRHAVEVNEEFKWLCELRILQLDRHIVMLLWQLKMDVYPVLC